MVWRIIRANILLIVNVILTDRICSLLVFFLAPAGLGKIQRNSQNIRTYYMLNHRIRCIYCMFIHDTENFLVVCSNGGWDSL